MQLKLLEAFWCLQVKVKMALRMYAAPPAVLMESM